MNQEVPRDDGLAGAMARNVQTVTAPPSPVGALVIGSAVRGRQLWPRLVCLVMILVATVVVHSRVIVADVPLHWDEQLYAVYGLQIHNDLVRGDLMSLAWDTYGAARYPPVFYWLEAAAFALLGPAKTSARIVSLAAFAVLGLLLLAIGRRLHSTNGLWVGAIAFGATAVSIVLAQLAGQAMLESTGLAMMMITLWVYLGAMADTGWRRWALTGLLVDLTYLTRTSFGLLLGGAILLNELIHVAVHLGTRVKDPASSRETSDHGVRSAFNFRLSIPIVAFAVPVLLFALIWFSGENRVRYYGYLPNRARSIIVGADRPGTTEMLYLPSSLGELAGSWPLAGLLLAGWAVAAWHWRDRRQRILVLLVALQFGAVELAPNQIKFLRYLVVILPPLGLLTGYWIVTLVERWSGQRRWLSLAAGLLLALTFGVHEAQLIRDIRAPTDTTAYALLDWVDGQLRANGPALILSSGEIVSPQAGLLDWHLAVESHLMDPRGGDLLFHCSYGAWFAGPWGDRLGRLGLDGLARRLTAVARTRELPPGLTRTLYLAENDPNQQPETPDELADLLQGRIEASQLKTVIVLIAETVDARYPASFYHAAISKLGFKVSSQESDFRIFPEGPVRVLVYRRP